MFHPTSKTGRPRPTNRWRDRVHHKTLHLDHWPTEHRFLFRMSGTSFVALPPPQKREKHPWTWRQEPESNRLFIFYPGCKVAGHIRTDAEGLHLFKSLQGILPICQVSLICQHHIEALHIRASSDLNPKAVFPGAGFQARLRPSVFKASSVNVELAHDTKKKRV